jgi:hypothetical protein
MQYHMYNRITLFLAISLGISSLKVTGFHRIGSASRRSIRRLEKGSFWYSSEMSKTALSSETAVELDAEMKSAEDHSTFLLLEHVNLNVPDHASALPFYLELLGCGVDPRRAGNLHSGTGTVWANCGASQFHLPYGAVAQRIPGKMGLRFPAPAWDALRQRVAGLPPCVQSSTEGMDRFGNPYVELTNHQGNVFFCRPETNQGARRVDQIRQPIVSHTDSELWGSVAAQYGKELSDCCGMDFVEFSCPKGSAEKIALFYDSVFDAPATVVDDGSSKVAIVAVGAVNAGNGAADQSIIFREVDSPDIPVYDGHHIAIFVGDKKEDFEQAYRNCELAGLIWVNPRFSDKADSLEGAREWKQFRFKNIIDMETGETIMELEHEMRSKEHDAWLGS